MYYNSPSWHEVHEVVVIAIDEFRGEATYDYADGDLKDLWGEQTCRFEHLTLEKPAKRRRIPRRHDDDE